MEQENTQKWEWSSTTPNMHDFWTSKVYMLHDATYMIWQNRSAIAKWYDSARWHRIGHCLWSLPTCDSVLTIVFKKGMTRYVYYTLSMEWKVGAHFSQQGLSPKQINAFQSPPLLRKEPSAASLPLGVTVRVPIARGFLGTSYICSLFPIKVRVSGFRES